MRIVSGKGRREEGEQAPQHLRHAAIAQERPYEIHDSQEDDGREQCLTERSVNLIDAAGNTFRLANHSVEQESEHDQ
jgi:hypothetical protein